MEIQTHDQTLSEEEKRTILSVEPNTILTFQYFRFKDYVYSVYLSCLMLRNGITEEKISAALPLIEKSINVPKFTKNIRKALIKLREKKYLHLHRNGTYSTVSQCFANLRNREMFNIRTKNFYDSKFIIKAWQIKYYREESNDPSFKEFLFGELLARYYFEIPTTHDNIQKTFSLSRYETNKITDLKTKQHHLRHYNENDTSFHNININYACIGNKYYKDFFATNFKLTPHLQSKITYIDKNIFDVWGDVFSHSKKVSFIKEVMGIKNSGSLSVREITVRYPSFFEEGKRNGFLPKLSQKLIINGLKHNNFIRKSIVRQDKDMLWWKEPKNLENYVHPYRFNSPKLAVFHAIK